MEPIAAILDQKLQQWPHETREEVLRRVGEIIELADHDLMDLVRSRAIEQDVLDILDEPAAR